MTLLRQLLAVACITGAATLAGCTVADGSEPADGSEAADPGPDPIGAYPDDQDGEPNQSFVDAPPADGESEPEAAPADERAAEATCNQCSNCVLYARCRMPRLPFGLTSYRDKVAQINRWSPRAGCVAVIYTGSYYGHVAYVTNVSGSTISIAEGNWPAGRCGRRSGTQSGLRIKGYICR